MTRPERYSICPIVAALMVCLIAVISLPARAAEPPAAAAAAPTEAALLDVLKSNASLEAKSAACRQLARVGTAQAVPVLAGLLGDEKLSHMARYALEQVPGAAVEDALRSAAGKLKGRCLAGVLDSLGVRRDAKAVDAIAPLLGDADAEVAASAALALGRIATPEAGKALDQAATAAGTPKAVQPAVWDATIRCADALAANTASRDQAAAIFDHLRAADVPVQYRVAATRGAIVARGPAGAAMLAELLSDKDPALFRLALRLAVELPGPDVTAALAGAAAAGKLPAERQGPLIAALGNRGDRAAGAAIRAAAAHADAAVRAAPAPADAAVRVAAIRALGQLADPAALPLLLAAMSDKDKPVADAAGLALANLPGAEVDKALGEQAASAEGDKALPAIDCLAHRRAAGAAPLLLKLAREGSPEVRPAAMKALAEVAAPTDLPQLVQFLLAAPTQGERDAVERAMTAACAPADDKDAVADTLIEPLAKAQTPQRLALLRVLDSAHGNKALAAVRGAVNDPNAAVQDLAVQAISNWRTQAVAGDLLELAKNFPKPAHKLLALRGYILLAYDAALPADKRAAMCAQALPIAQRDDEKRLLLGALSGLASADGLAMIVQLMDTPAVAEEACVAAVSSAGLLAKAAGGEKSAAAIAPAMEKVKQTTKNPRTQQAAQKLLDQAQKAPKP
jgi:HEAT repeat protein